MFVWVGALMALAPLNGRLLAQTPQQEFLPAANIARETLPALPLLYGAYAFVWVALLAYVFLLWRRLGRVERELAEITARLAHER
jgi:CcmD family protein